jgi:hypothetical protein
MCSAKSEGHCYRCKGSGKIKIDVMVDCEFCAPLHRHYVYDCQNACCVRQSFERECCHCDGKGFIH